MNDDGGRTDPLPSKLWGAGEGDAADASGPRDRQFGHRGAEDVAGVD